MGGVCYWGGLLLGGLLPGGLLPGGSAPRGVCSRGGLFQGGCLLLGWCLLPGGGNPACTEAETPPGETATAADGTHPTGMHSC